MDHLILLVFVKYGKGLNVVFFGQSACVLLSEKRGRVGVKRAIQRAVGSQRFSSLAAALPHFLQMNFGFLTRSFTV